MDPSQEGLLHPDRSRNSFDSAHSDVDVERHPSDHTQNEKPRGVAVIRSLLKRRKRFFTVLFIILGTWFLIGLGAPVAYNTYTQAPPDGYSPPWYPTPRGGSAKSWTESYQKAAKMVERMTLAEKVNITTGTGWRMGLAVGTTGPAVHVGFPQLALQDGPLGIRFADNATAFPAGITVGATWNKELMYERGKAHGLEARLKGVNVLLGPCIGPVGKMPAGGRNWEGFGSDPYLQGIAGAETIRGIQSEGVMATIKHFVGNEQEHFRQAREWALPNAISSNIDDRTMHEVYAWPFADAVKAGVASVMCSYNQVNNSYGCANSKLLNGILKDEFGFQGFVMSDWLAQRGGVSSALAGLDMSMPGDGLKWEDGESLWGPNLSRAVLNGSIPLERLNDMVSRIVASWYQLGQDDEALFDRQGPNFSSWTNDRFGVPFPGSPADQDLVEVNRFIDVQGDHKDVARRVAAEGTILLKNDGILPLGRDGSRASGKKRDDGGKVRIAIFGEDAGPGKGPNHCPDRGCNQGTLGSGWGSGAVEFPYLVTPAEGLRRQFDKDKVVITEHLSNKFKYHENPAVLDDQDICIVFASATAGEGYMSWKSVRGDRPDLYLQKGGDKLIHKVAEKCGNGDGETIVVIHSVGPVIYERFIDLPNVRAVVLGNLPGQESGNALADIIFGDVNPSGKLPYTVGKSLEDYGEGGQIMYLPNAIVPQQEFKDGLYIDYRYFDKERIEPRFEFGFGLSYTTFGFANVVISPVKAKTALPSPRPEPGAKPPRYDDKIPGSNEVIFPDEIRRLEKYIYPYVESIDDLELEPYPYPEGYDVEQPLSEAGGDEGGNPDLWETYVTVKVDVTNTGPVGGKAVAQLYLSYPVQTAVDVPVKVLRGFEKVYLEKGETKTVEFAVTRRDLSYWDVERQNWVMFTEGEYKFSVGASSRDLPVSGTW